MKTLTHHPDNATVIAYGAGALGEGFSLVLAAHMEACEQCRRSLAGAEMLGGELLDDIQPADMETGDLSDFWEKVQNEPMSEPVVARNHSHYQNVPEVLAPYLDGELDTLTWRSLVPGIMQHVISDVESGRGSVRLLSIAPGTTIPRHTHGGSELTLVLKGSYADEIGRFKSGDLADLDPSVYHQPVVDGDESCVCLIATDERLHFSGVFSRMLQPLIGI